MTTSNYKKAEALVAFHEKHTQSRCEKIQHIIRKIEKLRIEFPSRTRLSEYVAMELSESEGAPVSATTIRRNDLYNGILIDYLLRVSPDKVRGKIDKSIEASVYARQLQKTIEEKDKKISELETKLNETEVLLGKRLELEYAEKFDAQKSKVEKIVRNKKESFESLFEIIYSLLIELGSVEFNAEKGYVMDEAEDNVIMTRNNFPEFFSWLKNKI